MFLHLFHRPTNLQFVMVNNILVSGRGLHKRVQLVHIGHVPPNSVKVGGYFKTCKIFPCKENGDDVRIDFMKSIVTSRKETKEWNSKGVTG